MSDSHIASYYAMLASFGGYSSLVSKPEAGLVQAPDGMFFGTSIYGGIANRFFPLGCGAVYSATATGTITPLHEFTCTNGASPGAALLLGSDGLLYGTTVEGSGRSSNGLIFRIARSGSGFRVLHYFQKDEGTIPYAALIEGKDGMLYGDTTSGPLPKHTGTVFRMHRDGSGCQILHAFLQGEGDFLDAPLLQTSDGTLYGTALRGGNPFWAGTIFKLRPDGAQFKVLHYFSGYSDGFNPNGGLTRGPDGRLYGEALSQTLAEIFATTLTGQVQVVHLLTKGDLYPEGGLLLGSDERFYGEGSGGFGHFGAIFAFDPKTKRIEQIHRFRGAPNDGAEAWSRLVQSTIDHRYYGITSAGGSGGCIKFAPAGCGTMFSFIP